MTPADHISQARRSLETAQYLLAGDSADKAGREAYPAIVLIEGDDGSTFFHRDSEAARAAIACQVELQRRAGGNALIGRQFYPLLQGAGFAHVTVSPRMVYADGSIPALVDGVREQALATGLPTRRRSRQASTHRRAGWRVLLHFFKATGISAAAEA